MFNEQMSYRKGQGAMTTTTSRLHDFLDHWAEALPESLFAAQGGRRLTYREALGAVNRLANAFVAAGLGVGDRVAVHSKNSIEYVLIYFAARRRVSLWFPSTTGWRCRSGPTFSTMPSPEYL